MDEAAMVRVIQRVKARLPDVKEPRIEIEGDRGVCVGLLGGDAFGVPFDPDLSRTEDELVEWICGYWRELGAAVLPEIVLQGPTAVVLGGHQLRIAELQQAVTSIPRAKVDASQPYTAEEAEADVERVSRVLMSSYIGGADSEREEPATDDPKPHAAKIRDASAWRRGAALLLSKLHGWTRGAPPNSPGHHHARSVFEDPTGGGE